MNDPWRDDEISVVLDSYFAMLILELSGATFVKAEHRRRTQRLLPERSAKSIEFKWSNISAVLAEASLPWINGFKPRSHYQERLRELTATWLAQNEYLRTVFEERAS
jgi:hypothetical protein